MTLRLRGGPLNGISVMVPAEGPITVAIQRARHGHPVAVDCPYATARVGRPGQPGLTIELVTYTRDGVHVTSGESTLHHAGPVAAGVRLRR